VVEALGEDDNEGGDCDGEIVAGGEEKQFGEGVVWGWED
jgi:hypothetical protein